jgi:TonB family protein
MFRTIYFPANPYGGQSELKSFFRQELVYPRQALEEGKSGEVFITYLIHPNGSVKFKEVISNDSVQAFLDEASRVFDKILWEPDKGRDLESLGYEKLKIIFNPKKYKKAVKRRGYDLLPYPNLTIDSSYKYYSINELKEKPSITNANSINEFISNNIKYPPIAMQRNISGRVTVEFIIEPYGKTSNVRVIEPLAGGCNEETIRLMKAIEWSPGVKDGKAVRTLYTYQLNFVHPGGTVK